MPGWCPPNDGDWATRRAEAKANLEEDGLPYDQTFTFTVESDDQAEGMGYYFRCVPFNKHGAPGADCDVQPGSPWTRLPPRLSQRAEKSCPTNCIGMPWSNTGGSRPAG